MNCAYAVLCLIRMRVVIGRLNSECLGQGENYNMSLQHDGAAHRS